MTDLPDYPALHHKLDFYTLGITRDGDQYKAWTEPSFGASSGITHEVIAPTLIEAIQEMERLLSESYYYIESLKN